MSEQQPDANGWHKIADVDPPEDDWLLWWFEDGERAEVGRRRDVWVYGIEQSYPIAALTHWRPLVQPPVERERDNG